MNEAEITALRVGMGRLGYKVKFCPYSGFIQLFKKDIKFDAGYDHTNVQYLFISPLKMEEVRKKKLFKMSCIWQNDDKCILSFGNKYHGTIGYPTNEYVIYTMNGPASLYPSNHSYYRSHDKFLFNGQILHDPSNVWELPNGQLHKIDSVVKLTPTNFKIHKGVIMEIKTSINFTDVVAFIVDTKLYFIQKHKLNSYTKHSLNLDGNEYCFVRSICINDPWESGLYNAVTGKAADNIIFEKYETIYKPPNEVFTADGKIYPKSINHSLIYKLGENMYFAKTVNDAIIHIFPARPS